MPSFSFHPHNRPSATITFDLEDLDRVINRVWKVLEKEGTKHLYACSRIDGEMQYLHRWIVGARQQDEVRLVDGNPLNCRRENLVLFRNEDLVLVDRTQHDPDLKVSRPGEQVVRSKLADGSTKTYVYDKQTRKLLRSWISDPAPEPAPEETT